jgi:hypothetical protein
LPCRRRFRLVNVVCIQFLHVLVGRGEKRVGVGVGMGSKIG